MIPHFVVDLCGWTFILGVGGSFAYVLSAVAVNGIERVRCRRQQQRLDRQYIEAVLAGRD